MNGDNITAKDISMQIFDLQNLLVKYAQVRQLLIINLCEKTADESLEEALCFLYQDEIAACRLILAQIRT